MIGVRWIAFCKWGIPGLVCLVGLIGCQRQAVSEADAVPYYNTPDLTPTWLTDPAEVQRKITHHIAPFRFTNQEGQVITEDSVRGKVYVANFFFTACPTVCPKMTGLLKMVQDTFALNPKVALLSFSVMPWLDSVSQLRQYAQAKGVRSGKWHLLTGERGKIYKLARQSYFAEEALGFTKDSTEFLHTEHLILVDQHRRIRGVYNGTVPLEIEKLIGDVKALLGAE